MSTGTSTERREPKGAVEHAAANARYLYIKYGCLCEVSKTAVEGWTHPVHQKTQEIIRDKWVKVYKSVEAWVNKLEWYDRTHGDEVYQGWKMHMSAGEVNYILDLPLNSEATKKFMMSARNMDFDMPLEIAAWTSREDGKLAVWLKQNDQSILQYYKKGDMKECPEPVQRPVIGGKLKWDWEATDAFLWNEMQNTIAPHIEKLAADRGYTAAAPQHAEQGSFPSHSGSTPAGATEAPPHPQGCRCSNCLPDDDIPF